MIIFNGNIFKTEMSLFVRLYKVVNSGLASILAQRTRAKLGSFVPMFGV